MLGGMGLLFVNPSCLEGFICSSFLFQQLQTPALLSATVVVCIVSHVEITFLFVMFQWRRQCISTALTL